MGRNGHNELRVCTYFKLQFQVAVSSNPCSQVQLLKSEVVHWGRFSFISLKVDEHTRASPPSYHKIKLISFSKQIKHYNKMQTLSATVMAQEGVAPMSAKHYEQHRLVGSTATLSTAACATLNEDLKSSKSPRRRRTKVPKQGQKVAFTKMIAQEEVVTSSFLNDGDGETINNGSVEGKLLNSFQAKLQESPKTSEKKSRRSKRVSSSKKKEKKIMMNPDALADLYYSQMGGGIQVNYVEEVDFTDCSSFAGLELDEYVEECQRLGNDISHASCSSRSGSSIYTGTSSVSFRSGGSKSAETDNGGRLFLDEIKRGVMEQIHESVRNQIPEEAWDQIFDDEILARARSGSQSGSGASPLEGMHVLAKEGAGLVNEDLAINEEDDDTSVRSDISGLTVIFPSTGPITLSLDDTDTTEDTGISSEDEDEPLHIAAPSRKAFTPVKAPRGEHKVDRATNTKTQRPIPSSQHYNDDLNVGTQCSRATCSTSSRSTVQFNEVHVRAYERILSDNPACQSGPSIGIGWRYKRAGILSVDDWESKRGDPRRPSELVMPRHVRENMLIGLGYDKKAMAEQTRKSLKIKAQRRTTINNLSAQGVEEAVEKARRKVKSILLFGMKC